MYCLVAWFIAIRSIVENPRPSFAWAGILGIGNVSSHYARGAEVELFGRLFVVESWVMMGRVVVADAEQRRLGFGGFAELIQIVSCARRGLILLALAAALGFVSLSLLS